MEKLSTYLPYPARRLFAYFIDSFLISLIEIVFFTIVYKTSIWGINRLRTAKLLPSPGDPYELPMAIAVIILLPALFIIPVVYVSLFERSPMRATVGKKICGLIVTDEIGNQLTFHTAFTRAFFRELTGSCLWVLTWFIPPILSFIYLMANDKHQGIHDKLSHTLVQPIGGIMAETGKTIIFNGPNSTYIEVSENKGQISINNSSPNFHGILTEEITRLITRLEAEQLSNYNRAAISSLKLIEEHAKKGEKEETIKRLVEFGKVFGDQVIYLAKEIGVSLVAEIIMKSIGWI